MTRKTEKQKWIKIRVLYQPLAKYNYEYIYFKRKEIKCSAKLSKERGCSSFQACVLNLRGAGRDEGAEGAD